MAERLGLLAAAAWLMLAPAPAAEPEAKGAAPAPATVPSVGAAGGPLAVGLYHAPPLCIRPTDAQPEWSGLAVDFWKMLASRLKLDYRFVEAPPGELVTLIDNNAVDFGLGPLAKTEDGEKLIDYLHPYFVSDLAIAMPKRPLLSAWIQVARDFMTLGWLLAILGLVGLLLVVSLIVLLIERSRRPKLPPQSPGHDIFHAFYWAATTMTTVGYGDVTPVSRSGRLLAIAWMLVSMIVVAILTASITSSVTFHRLVSDIRGPGDLNRCVTGAVAGTEGERFLIDERLARESFPDLSAALDALLTGKVDAVVADHPRLEWNALHQYKSRLRIIPFNYQRTLFSIGVPEEKSQREAWNQAVLGILASPEWRETLRKYAQAP